MDVSFTYGIPVFLRVRLSFPGFVFEGVEHGYGTTQQDKALQGGAPVVVGGLQNLSSSKYVSFPSEDYFFIRFTYPATAGSIISF